MHLPAQAGTRERRSVLSEKSLALAKKSRELILKMTSQAQAAHVASSLSVIDLLAVSYEELRIDSDLWSPWAGFDILILSKGHAAAGLYAVLGTKGFFPRKALTHYGQDDGLLGGHATFGVPGVELSTGSLGHGLPFGLGIALQRKRLSKPGRVVVIMSDGELDEGTTWESLLIANHHMLDNLILLVDRNRLQSLEGTEDTLRLEPLDEKFRAFGWRTEVIDGHNHNEIADFINFENDSRKPSVAICETLKGKGVSFMEGNVKWHYRPPNVDELNKALDEVSRS